MKDKEIAVIKPNSTSLDISRVEVAPENDVLLTADPYPHFTIKECLEQPEAIARALSYGMFKISYEINIFW
jgi:glucosamine--fructose-6-phosphate aminotransferase (isomerizing)